MEAFGGDSLQVWPELRSNRHLNSPACKLMPPVQDNTRCNGIILFCKPAVGLEHCYEKVVFYGVL